MWRTCPACGALVAAFQLHVDAHTRYGDPLSPEHTDLLLNGPVQDRDR